ncbi:MAG: (2Fe-2S)-binding protein [Polyangiaceae bacterium]|nr:(2Fe-2S)-binding protein [Polyangiaceae bacterium]
MVKTDHDHQHHIDIEFQSARRNLNEGEDVFIGNNAPTLDSAIQLQLLSDFFASHSVMLICHCREVSHHNIHAVIDDGASTVSKVAKSCGAGNSCGGCIPAIREILESKSALNSADLVTSRQTLQHSTRTLPIDTTSALAAAE